MKFYIMGCNHQSHLQQHVFSFLKYYHHTKIPNRNYKSPYILLKTTLAISKWQSNNKKIALHQNPKSNIGFDLHIFL